MSVETEWQAWQNAAFSTRRLARKRVARGMHLLDLKLGGVWVFHMNLERFDLASGCTCVLGQLAVDIVPKRQWMYRGRRRWVPAYSNAVETLQLSGGQERTHGFLNDYKLGLTYDVLAYAWRHAIAQRTGCR